MHLRQIAAPPLDTTIRPQSRQRHACEGLRIRIWPCTPAPFAGMQHESEPTRFGNPLRFNQTGKCSSCAFAQTFRAFCLHFKGLLLRDAALGTAPREEALPFVSF